MQVVRKGETEVRKGTTFTGDVQMEPLHIQRDAGVGLTVVHFEDGARTHWHTHPGEQLLYILKGEGRVGNEHEEIQVTEGDVVYTGPGEKHWHGAMPGHDMTHLSITNVGGPEWLEPVED